MSLTLITQNGVATRMASIRASPDQKSSTTNDMSEMTEETTTTTPLAPTTGDMSEMTEETTTTTPLASTTDDLGVVVVGNNDNDYSSSIDD